MYDSYIHTAHIRLHTSVSIRSTVQYVYTYSDTTTKTTILNDAYIRQYNTEKRTVRTAKCTKIKWWSESNAISGGKIMIKVEADVFEYFFLNHRSRDSFSCVLDVEINRVRSVGWLFSCKHKLINFALFPPKFVVQIQRYIRIFLIGWTKSKKIWNLNLLKWKKMQRFHLWKILLFHLKEFKIIAMENVFHVFG